ncbi:hypothetical protein Tco_0909571 [Tanacetum coccineum]|uniref:Uncharacterized protein n=1 Tax=Tanacetum coccineum TaxID=301880 RepID=A0ABQ5CTU5_9ASTR
MLAVQPSCVYEVESIILLAVKSRLFPYRHLEFHIMGEPLSPDCVFDFPVDEPEPHPAYNFFVPGPLLGYAGPMVDEDAEPVAEVEVEQVIAPVVDMDEDIAMLFGDDEFEDDAS